MARSHSRRNDARASGDYRTEHEAHGSNDIGGLRDEQDAQDVHDEHDLQDEGEA
jgi:hypothetical protein